MRLFTFTSAAVLLAGAAFAQETVLSTGAAGERNDDLLDAVEEDFVREVDTLDNRGRPTGFNGSLAARGTLSDGNTDSVDIGIGANFGYFDGVNGYGLELSYSFGETDGVVTEESLVYDLEYRRDFGSRFFGFGKVQGSFDDFSSFGNDTFVGFGAGYRIFDTQDLQWTVQGGPGYRVADLTDPLSTDIEEGAFAISSNYFNAFSVGTSVSMDTDVIISESDTVVFNSLALTQNINSSLALRTSLDTEYHTDPAAGFDDTDNTVGVSLVYSFN